LFELLCSLYQLILPENLVRWGTIASSGFQFTCSLADADVVDTHLCSPITLFFKFFGSPLDGANFLFFTTIQHGYLPTNVSLVPQASVQRPLALPELCPTSHSHLLRAPSNPTVRFPTLSSLPQNPNSQSNLPISPTFVHATLLVLPPSR